MSDPPEKDARDYAYAALKAGVATVPVVGGAAATLLDEVLGPPLQRRRDAFTEGLNERIAELIEKVEGIERADLSENEQFVTAATKAAQIALRTHHQAKIDALLNAVQNAVDSHLEDDVQHMFLAAVDGLTPTHLQVLEFLHDPADFLTRHGIQTNVWSSSPMGELNRALPHLAKKASIRDRVIADLKAWGFVRRASLETSGTNSRESQTSELGEQFLTFLTRRQFD